MDKWVVRGGLASAQNLQDGYVPHPAVAHVYGFSVQHAPGKSIEELAQAGHFLNTQISYAQKLDLERNLLQYGYQMKLVLTPGGGFHRTCMVIIDHSGQVLSFLPIDVAQIISQTFQRMKNPYQQKGAP